MVISFVNQKGGVGKTTTAINLAISLKKKNYNLVFIDADREALFNGTQLRAITHWKYCIIPAQFKLTI